MNVSRISGFSGSSGIVSFLRQNSIARVLHNPVDGTLSWNQTASKKSFSSFASAGGFLSRLWEQHSPQGHQQRIMVGERLFRAAQSRATDPVWYSSGRIAETFRSHHAVLSMHVWFFHRRLISEHAANGSKFSLLVQEELFEILWNDTRARIRAEGVNELTVSKHLENVQQVTFQHLTHYDHAFTEYASDSKKRFDELAAAIWIHILLRDEGATDDQIKRLAAYVEYQHENIMLRLPEQYFREGRVAWGDVPDFTGMRDNTGLLLRDVEVKEQYELPEGWSKVLNDAGESYYWDMTTNKTQWDSPVMK